jgi:hypothetical protein
MVEDLLRKKFQHVDAYRYNSASLRVRVIDPVFQGKSQAQRDRLVSRLLDRLPVPIQADIVMLVTLTPNEARDFGGSFLENLEFDNPSRSLF